MPLLPSWLKPLMQAEAQAQMARHVGWLSSAYTAGILLGALFWGVISDCHGRRPVLLLGMAGYVVSLVPLIDPGTIGLAATQVNVFVNTVLATGQGTGAVSWLNYAFRLMYLPIGLFGVSVATATVPPTRTSRMITTQQNHAGADPSMMIAVMPTMNSKRSAVGSNILPNSLTWLKRRASHPSTQSVAPRQPRRSAAPGTLSRGNNRYRKTGMQQRRTSVNRLGAVRYFREESSSSSSDIGRSVQGRREPMRTIEA